MVTFYRRLPRFEYVQPKSLDEALSLLAEHKGKAKLIAGGTDLLPKMKGREIKAPTHVIDLKGLPDLDYIKYDEEDGLAIGALATIHAVETSPIIQQKFSVLAQAASSMASTQVRNRGTVAGNICNAVPSADSAPALLTLEARVTLISKEGERIVSLENFFTGPNETVLTDTELLAEIQIPNLPPNSRGVYVKLTPRRSMDLAVVGVAAVVIAEDGVCEDIRIGLGAVAPTPIRAKRAEDTVRGQQFTEERIERSAKTAAEESRPIDDHRASAEYRRWMVQALVRRAINQAIS
ncbi:MAG: xanthine dehydrogenase family protein subunit M [Deltaproteobacteria bacterium]|nr:MAG: xanthine dehydrogenase family protein subunit M [Deltaproteobacteria bacterium]